MTSNRRGGRPSPGRNVPPVGRRSARQQRLANREANRTLARAGTGGSHGAGPRLLLVWSLAFVVVAVVLVGAAFVLSNGSSSDLTTPTVLTPTNIASSGGTLGNASAPVTIDVYGDFRCTACAVFTIRGTESSLVDTYVATGKAKLVWHDYLQIDKNRRETTSRDAANAAWCAADQGKFWVMHDWLFANQSPSESPSAFAQARLTAIGKAAGLDMSKYQTCLNNGTHNAAIAAEDSRTPAQVTGTPAVFVNSKFVAGATANSWPGYDLIKAAIDAASASPTPTPSASASASASAS